MAALELPAPAYAIYGNHGFRRPDGTGASGAAHARATASPRQPASRDRGPRPDAPADRGPTSDQRREAGVAGPARRDRRRVGRCGAGGEWLPRGARVRGRNNKRQQNLDIEERVMRETRIPDPGDRRVKPYGDPPGAPRRRRRDARPRPHALWPTTPLPLALPHRTRTSTHIAHLSGRCGHSLLRRLWGTVDATLVL